ncbi:hypothetical protein LCGC14_2402090, partial [marine sediment metagenome]
DVQPEDLLPGDIRPAFGAPWIPAEDIEAFVGDLLDVPSYKSEGIKVTNIPQEGTWRINVRPGIRHLVENTETWGSPGYPAHKLIETALNQKLPTVYYAVEGNRRAVHMESTLAAREKQEQIKERFRKWLWEDEERAERLSRKYNNDYNNIRVRTFDGSHLTLPGSGTAVTLQKHQKDAIWRIVQTGNTLLGHVVGAGKTYTMVGAGMEMKRIGLVKKPMYVVPNHMLDQFSREFLILYPSARILVAGKENFIGDRRRKFMAQIATGEWDAIILTHSSFGRLPVSPEFQTQFIKKQIDEYAALIVEAKDENDRSLVKELEKAKKRKEEQLKRLAARERKDVSMWFEELGVDFMFIDEAHLFKNLDTPTKMGNLVGISTPSQRAFDLLMKIKYLEQVNPNRAAAFATGTPISNTLAEMHVMQRYLQRPELEKRNLLHFDAWAAMFAETETAAEVGVDGRYKVKSRLSKFNNIQELMQVFREVADIKTRDDLDLPTPELTNLEVSAPKSKDMERFMAELVKRVDAVLGGKVEPEEDN